VKLRADVVGNIAAQMREVERDGERASSRALGKAGDGLKEDWRGQITNSGLGMRLARTIRARSYPKGQASLDAAAVVWSNAPDIVRAFDEGALIRSRSGFWLAIPTEAAGKRGLGRKRVTPEGWEQRTGLKLRFVYRRGAPSLLVAEGRVSKSGRAVRSRSKTGRGLQTVPIFILVPQVRLAKRLDLERDVDRWLRRLPGLIVSNWKEGP